MRNIGTVELKQPDYKTGSNMAMLLFVAWLIFTTKRGDLPTIVDIIKGKKSSSAVTQSAATQNTILQTPQQFKQGLSQ